MEEKKIKKSLRYSIYDGIAFAFMDGLTTSYLTPFAIALNASIKVIAALSYVPQLIGAFIQLFAARLVEIVKDRRKILIVCSLLHSFLWLPLIFLPYLSPDKRYLLIVYVTLQTIISDIIGPVGTSLIGDIVPKYERGRFFGKRNRIVGITSFIATLFAGLTLNYFSPKNPFVGFSILFGLAFVARVFSALFKAGMENPLPDLQNAERFSLFDFVKKMDKTNYGRFVIYLTLYKFAVNIASPFFAVYMIKILNFSYLQFTLITAIEIIASFIAMNIWGKLIDSKGTKLVLYISGILTPFVPLLWLFSKNYHYLLIVQAFAGASWAGFNLSASNFIFDAVKPANRVRCVAYSKFFEGSALFFGALLGGVLIDKLHSNVFSSITYVFLVSFILRFITSIVLLPTLKEARLIEMGIGTSFFKNYLLIRPTQGIVYEVIGKYLKPKTNLPAKENKVSEKEKPSKDKDMPHNKRLIGYITKNIKKKTEEHSITDMHKIEHITQKIDKRVKKE